MSANEEAMNQAVDRLRRAERVAVTTGAGISAESGVPTFRGPQGLWEGQPVEKVATPSAFRKDPGLVWRFYNARRAQLKQVEPNPGHLALVELERMLGKDRFTLITQNVDGLHRRAGSERVVELHGNLAWVRCTSCSYLADRGGETLDDLPQCPRCTHLLRPHIVWFHEMLPPDQWMAAESAVHECNVLLVVGTSAVVYPAAGLIEVARQRRAAIIEVNLTSTVASDLADIALHGKSGEILPRLVARYKAG